MEDNAADIHSKLKLKGKRITVPAKDSSRLVKVIFVQIGCSSKTAVQVAKHLIDTILSGMEAHSWMRTLQYVEQFQNGDIIPKAEPSYRRTNKGADEMDGCGGIGITVMHLSYECGTF